MFGEPLVEFETLGSTNQYALEWVDAPHGACVLARAQTRGRGRLGRDWASPQGKGLYVSVVLHRDGAVAGQLALASALAVALALEGTAGVKINIKWPNDILAVNASHQRCKIAGILCEARPTDGGQRVVVGIGLNLNHELADFPERLHFPASSLQLLTGQPWQPSQILPALLAELDAVDQQLAAGGWLQVLAAINTRLCGVGEVVKVSGAGEAQVGLVEYVDQDGRLVVRTAAGPQAILAGDVSYI